MQDLRFLGSDEFYKDGLEYKLIDSHYRSNDFENGRIFKRFFDDFCKQVFDINLAMLKDSGDFPIAWNEKNSYSSIACALGNLGFHSISEFSLNTQGYGINSRYDNEREQKSRSIDFIAWDKKIFNAIEVKRIDLNITHNTEGFKDYCDKNINDALRQIYSIKKADFDKRVGYCNKIALLNTPLWFKENKTPSDKDIQNAPKLLMELVSSYLDKRRKMGVLCGVLDFRGTFGTKKEEDYRIFKGEKIPYIALVGIVLE